MQKKLMKVPRWCALLASITLGASTVTSTASAQNADDLVRRMDALISGEYGARAAAEEAGKPVVNRSQGQILAAGRQAVLEELRDPDSARFRNVRYLMLANGTAAFCGEVNARNNLGGYVGYVRFKALVSNRGASSADLDASEGLNAAAFENRWRQTCSLGGGIAVQF